MRRDGSGRHGQPKAEGTGLGSAGAGRPLPSLKGSPIDKGQTVETPQTSGAQRPTPAKRASPEPGLGARTPLLDDRRRGQEGIRIEERWEQQLASLVGRDAETSVRRIPDAGTPKRPVDQPGLDPQPVLGGIKVRVG